MTDTPWYVNGRAGATGPGGFARFHHEVVDRLDARGPLVVVTPPAGRSGPVSARWWEQWTLPTRSRDGVLLSTANNGPLRHPNQAVVVHDILPLTHPETVSPVFAALQRAQLPRLCRSAAAVITVSDHVAGQLRSVLEVAADKITVVPPGVSDVFRTAATGSRRGAGLRPEWGLDPDRPIVTALVSSIPRKRSDLVLETLAAVASARPNAQVVVAGYDGPARVFGRRAARPTHPAVRDLGPLDDSELAALFHAAAVFVSLTAAEGFGLPPLEALAAGAAVVSTPVPSLREHLPGVTVSATDQTEAAAGVIDLLDDPTARSAQINRAADVVAGLTWDQTADGVGAVVNELTAERWELHGS